MEEEKKDSVMVKQTWTKPVLYDEDIANTLAATGGVNWDGTYSGS